MPQTPDGASETAPARTRATRGEEAPQPATDSGTPREGSETSQVIAMLQTLCFQRMGSQRAFKRMPRRKLNAERRSPNGFFARARRTCTVAYRAPAAHQFIGGRRRRRQRHHCETIRNHPPQQRNFLNKMTAKRQLFRIFANLWFFNDSELIRTDIRFRCFFNDVRRLIASGPSDAYSGQLPVRFVRALNG